ncbi:hypothetical protein WJ968_35885 [Achromobacter xylosoxidans]
MLGAKQLDADGRPERLTARVPGYALGVNNAVRVSVQRQPVSVDCNEIPQGYPVSVLPTSHVKPGQPQPDGTFTGLLPLLAGNPQVLVPDSYLANAPTSLKQLIGIATASGVSATRAELAVSPPARPPSPRAPSSPWNCPWRAPSPRSGSATRNSCRSRAGPPPGWTFPA